VDLEDLIGPLPAPLGRWMLRRLVAGGVRYGHDFAILLVRGADPAELSPLLRGADIFSSWDGGDLLALLPDTDRAGEFGRAGPLGQYDNRDLVLWFKAGTLPRLRRHLGG